MRGDCLSQVLAKIGLRGRISRIFDRRRVTSLCSIQQKRGAAVWMEPRQCQGGQKKDKIFLCMLILFPLLFSLLPSASSVPLFPSRASPHSVPFPKVNHCKPCPQTWSHVLHNTPHSNNLWCFYLSKSVWLEGTIDPFQCSWAFSSGILYGKGNDGYSSKRSKSLK